MGNSIPKIVATESLEILRDTAKEIVSQAKESGKVIVSTVGVKTGEPAPKKEDLSKLKKTDEAFKGVEIAQAKQTLFREQKNAEQKSFLERQQEIIAKNRQAQIEHEQQKQAVPILSANPLSAISSKPKPGGLFAFSKERVKKTQ